MQFNMNYKPECSEVDETGTDKYYGFMNFDGSGYILKEIANLDGTKSYRYARTDSGDFAGSWTGRALLTYGTYAAVFGG